MKKLKMKKLSVMAMVMAVMLSMTACGSQKTAKENNQGTEQESSAVQVTPTESKTFLYRSYKATPSLPLLILLFLKILLYYL